MFPALSVLYEIVVCRAQQFDTSRDCSSTVAQAHRSLYKPIGLTVHTFNFDWRF